MKFQNMKLPSKENKIGETPWLTELTVLKPILNKHMAPKGKVGLIIVREGSLDYVWEDDLDNVLTCDKNHPIVIEPERDMCAVLLPPASTLVPLRLNSVLLTVAALYVTYEAPL